MTGPAALDDVEPGFWQQDAIEHDSRTKSPSSDHRRRRATVLRFACAAAAGKALLPGEPLLGAPTGSTARVVAPQRRREWLGPWGVASATSAQAASRRLDGLRAQEGKERRQGHSAVAPSSIRHGLPRAEAGNGSVARGARTAGGDTSGSQSHR